MTLPAVQATLAPTTMACPRCSGPVDVKSRHIEVVGSAIRVFCSEDCLRGRVVDPVIDPVIPVRPRRRFRLRVLGIGIGVSGGLLLLGRAMNDDDPAPAAGAVTAPVAVDPPARQGANETQPQFEAAWAAELATDTWVHPIAGPERKMPRNHSQAFGAERAGDRPAECFSGHCGVDLGAGMWGEPIRAAHAGVVEHVNRGPNEDRGGIYVRLSHREGTVFTEYFHLAAVPRWIIPGTPVAAGQVIGLLGDSGVKHSAPHLHFTISVRPSKTSPERYLDPEPLISIWPLWIPDAAGDGQARASIAHPPGLPARGKRRRREAEPKPGATESPTASDPPATPPEAPEPTPSPSP